MKAQIWSIDFASSLTIFIIVLASVFLAWNYLSAQTQEQRAMDSMELFALEVSDALVRTPGIPEDWNSSYVEVVGLASHENVIDPDKLNATESMGYDRLRLLMTGGYDFYLIISDINGTTYLEKGSLPQNRTTVPVERYANYGDRIVKMKLCLWA